MIVLKEMQDDRREHLIRFYSILGALEACIGGQRTLADCSGRLGWPRRGVYFFLEASETRTDTGERPRIVRVGTHALKAGSGAKLWTRLSQHRGKGAGGGNHRGSIFRLIIGAALMARDGHAVPTWGRGNTATPDVVRTEDDFEREVSAVIRQMPFLWVSIDDAPGPESVRGVIERNSIALLSNYRKPPLDPPSPGWLGHHSDRERVRESGLWNSNHVDEPYDPAFLDTLEQLVSATSNR
jgi:hypothetical protein